MRVAIAGLGYVGSVTGACLADSGHHVTLVDINPIKIEQLNAGDAPVLEFGLAELIRSNVEKGRLRATSDLGAAVAGSEATIVCVGTPTGPKGDVNLADVEAVARQIGAALRDADEWHLVLVTSTVPPGTVESRVIPLLEKESGKTAGLHFGVAFSPEFLREGTAVADFREPAKTVVGATDRAAYDKVRVIFAPFTTNIIETSIGTAEMVKFTDNAWHALKVTFANEIGRICDALGVDSHAVMDIFKQDHRLNVSPAYLTPGFAFGGSCLPKDLRTLTYRARAAGVDIPVLDAVIPSNRAHVELALRKIESLGRRRIALLGVAFKSGTDDLRESPTLELAERLLGKGYDVAIHDDYVRLSRLVGANRDYVMTRLPHVAALLHEDLDAVIADAELIVIGQGSRLYGNLTTRLKANQLVLDLCGVARAQATSENYTGLAW